MTIQELKEMIDGLPPLDMSVKARHERDDHRECTYPDCIKADYDLRPVPVYMDVWLDHEASSIR